jgi:hexosaminidase
LQLQLGVDESYLLLVEKRNGQSIIGEAYIEVKFQF